MSTINLLKMREVVIDSRLSRSSVLNGVKNGTFPHPIKTGIRSIAWRSIDIEAWKRGDFFPSSKA